MDRTSLWPDFRDAWILFEDADIIAVDKPVGVSSQAADPTSPDDIATRLKRFLAARSAGGASYLGVHQRLDRDTSGVLVFARRREANGSLAVQFERRTVRKRYVACVTGWPAKRERETLRDALAADRDGRMRVTSPRERGAVKAVTRVRVLARRGQRAMLELELETGRTHQARVQLAHAGAPIAGDPTYGGAAAPRMMLHAAALGLEHPRTRKAMQFLSPLPAEFEEWLERGAAAGALYRDEGALSRALDRALQRRWGLGRSEGGPRPTTAFRLINEDGDGFPRLAVDVYGDWLVAQLYPGPSDDTRDGQGDPWAEPGSSDRLLDRLHALGFDGVYLKVRPRQARRSHDACPCAAKCPISRR